MAEEIEVPRIRVIVETETRRPTDLRQRRPVSIDSRDGAQRDLTAGLGRLDPCEHARVMRDERGKDDEETDRRNNRENGIGTDAPPQEHEWREERHQPKPRDHDAMGAGGVATSGPRLNSTGVPLAGCHTGFLAEMFSLQ